MWNQRHYEWISSTSSTTKHGPGCSSQVSYRSVAINTTIHNSSSPGLIPFVSLVYLNIRILISLRNLRSRLNTRCHGTQDDSNPHKGKQSNLFQILLPKWIIIPLVKLREMRVTQQSRDLNLAIVLISSVVMFLFCHTPRWYSSILRM